MKILNKTGDVPSQITYRGHIYKEGPGYGNLEQAQREASYLRARELKVTVRKFYVQPNRPFPYYVLYVRRG